jgi:hypothetical protein
MKIIFVPIIKFIWIIVKYAIIMPVVMVFESSSILFVFMCAVIWDFKMPKYEHMCSRTDDFYRTTSYDLNYKETFKRLLRAQVMECTHKV